MPEILSNVFLLFKWIGFSRFVRSIIICFCLPATIVVAQKRDHLVMDLEMEGSVLAVTASFTTEIQDSDSILYFILNPGFELQSLEAPGLESYVLSQKEDRPFPFYRLTFDRILEAGELIRVEFAYSFDLGTMNHLNSNWIELNTDKLWFPNFDDINNEFTYEVSFSGLSDSYDLVSHMRASVSRVNSVWSIRMEEPMLEVLILAADNMEIREFDENLNIFVSQQTPDSVVSSIAEIVQNSINYMNESFGSGDPITSFRVVLRNTSSEEIGFQFSRENMIITGVDFNDYANQSHEVSHYWWSGADFIAEPWMNESFANYSMLRVVRRFSPERYQRLKERFKTTAANAPSVTRSTLFSENAYDAYYFKGAYLLMVLEEKIGVEKMDQLLKNRVEKGIKSTNGFLEELGRLTNEETQAYFHDLLNSEGCGFCD